MFFFQRNWSMFVFFFFRSSSFSVIRVNVKIKNKLKERIRCVVVAFLSLKVRVVMQFTRGYLKWKISPRLTWRGGRADGRTRAIFSKPKCFGCCSELKCYFLLHCSNVWELGLKLVFFRNSDPPPPLSFFDMCFFACVVNSCILFVMFMFRKCSWFMQEIVLFMVLQ